MYGLAVIDLVVVAAYFVAVLAVGFWASRKVRNETDFFLGGRKFGKALLVMHWLCTGTHSEMAVQVTGAAARVGLGGIWYQWLYLFSTPFYWLLAPITRRMRVTTTGDFFRLRYGPGLEKLYAVIALVYVVLSVAMILRGAGVTISGITDGQLATEHSILILSLLFSSYVIAGGLVAAAYTDFFQGVMIIFLSAMLVPAGLALVGGTQGLHERLAPSAFNITAPPGSSEGDWRFVLAMSLVGLAGIIAQPHVMSATGSGKTETEARVGMVYGNFIKRLLTIAWAFTGLIAAVHFSGVLDVYGDLASVEAKHAGEKLFGLAVREWLGDGWRGLMIACLIAGVTSTETFLVVGAAVFTRNLYARLVPRQSDQHYLWTGRAASGGILLASAIVAVTAGSVTSLLTASVQLIGLLGPAVWIGVYWRRANPLAAWTSIVAGAAVWKCWHLATSPGAVAGVPILGDIASLLASAFHELSLTAHGKPAELLVTLAAGFGGLFLVALLTRPQVKSALDPFYARLLTPVGRESEVATPADAAHSSDAALDLDGVVLDYERARHYAYAGLARRGIEIPRLNWFDWAGFVLAWGLVALLIMLLRWLAGWGA